VVKDLSRKKIKSKVGRPKGRRCVKITISLPEQLLKIIDVARKGEAPISRSEFITRILEGYLYYKDEETTKFVKNYLYVVLPVMSFLSLIYDVAREKGKEITFKDIGNALVKAVETWRKTR